MHTIHHHTLQYISVSLSISLSLSLSLSIVILCGIFQSTRCLHITRFLLRRVVHTHTHARTRTHTLSSYYTLFTTACSTHTHTRTHTHAHVVFILQAFRVSGLGFVVWGCRSRAQGLRCSTLAYVTSSYILCHIIIHTMSHHHTYYVTSSYILLRAYGAVLWRLVSGWAEGLGIRVWGLGCGWGSEIRVHSLGYTVQFCVWG